MVPNAEIDLLVLGYLRERGHYHALIALEAEARLTIEHPISGELDFLRAKMFAGDWTAVARWLDSLRALHGNFVLVGHAADHALRTAHFATRKQALLELLSDDATAVSAAPPPDVERLVAEARALEPFCSAQEFREICFLLTLPRVTDFAEYRDWSPHKVCAVLVISSLVFSVAQFHMPSLPAPHAGSMELLASRRALAQCAALVESGQRLSAVARAGELGSDLALRFESPGRLARARRAIAWQWRVAVAGHWYRCCAINSEKCTNTCRCSAVIIGRLAPASRDRSRVHARFNQLYH
jgi:hypothetical protein